ncbi:peptidoglycan recognition protein 4 isoform X1 [Nycticebus coucang]|uniref:peptidoglycan recognition protein 4 isoform X1 n=1 Tax=Nycticebus coucang TaxID=9470 RepID=UPI00234D1465|nr:peptidoglycan recognition protein 4 isoform X1 [Nycticebus coucang]
MKLLSMCHVPRTEKPQPGAGLQGAFRALGAGAAGHKVVGVGAAWFAECRHVTKGCAAPRVAIHTCTLARSVSWAHVRMLLCFLIFSSLGLQVWGDSSWGKTQAKQTSEGLQYLFGNISQLIEKGKLGLNDVSAMVSRKEWGAEAVGCSTQLTTPVDVLIIHHVPGLQCHDQTGCSQRLCELQAHHAHSNGRCDVAYNFLVGDDGRVYEGVGWNVQGMHTQGYNNISLGFAFFGTKEGHSPSSAALSTMEGLISSAVQKGHLASRYIQPLLVKGENCLVPQQKESLKKASLWARMASFTKGWAGTPRDPAPLATTTLLWASPSWAPSQVYLLWVEVSAMEKNQQLSHPAYLGHQLEKENQTFLQPHAQDTT